MLIDDLLEQMGGPVAGALIALFGVALSQWNLRRLEVIKSRFYFSQKLDDYIFSTIPALFSTETTRSDYSSKLAILKVIFSSKGPNGKKILDILNKMPKENVSEEFPFMRDRLMAELLLYYSSTLKQSTFTNFFRRVK